MGSVWREGRAAVILPAETMKKCPSFALLGLVAIAFHSCRDKAPEAGAAPAPAARAAAAVPATNQQYEDMGAAYMRYRDAVAQGDWDGALAETSAATRSKLESSLDGTPSEEGKDGLLEAIAEKMPDELTLSGGKVVGERGFLSGKARMGGEPAVLEVEMASEDGRWKFVAESLTR